MRTEPAVRFRGSMPGPMLALVIVIGALVATFVLISRPSSSGAAVPIPADVERLGMEISPIAPGAVAVSAESAIAIAQEVASHLKDQKPNVDAYLVSATDPRWVEASGFEDRKIWIIRFSGLDLLFPGAPPADGSEAKGHTAHFAYVLVDADSKEAIDIQYWE